MDIVCLRNMSINTLHKGDYDDDDDDDDDDDNNNNNNNNNNNRGYEKGTCMLIDVLNSGDRNAIKKKPRRF